jgi:hypothetical protein
MHGRHIRRLSCFPIRRTATAWVHALPILRDALIARVARLRHPDIAIIRDHRQIRRIGVAVRIRS